MTIFEYTHKLGKLYSDLFLQWNRKLLFEQNRELEARFDGNQDAKVQESANGVNAPKAQEVFQFERKRLHFKPIEKIQEKVKCLDNISDSNIFASKNGWILDIAYIR